jgi:hypothetical protein
MDDYPNGLSEFARSAYLKANGDQEYWTDRSTGKSPFKLDNGVLEVGPTLVGVGNTPGGGSLAGVMTTQGSLSQQNGYFERRAELPQGAERDVLEAFGATAADGKGANQAHWDVMRNSLGTG